MRSTTSTTTVSRAHLPFGVLDNALVTRQCALRAAKPSDRTGSRVPPQRGPGDRHIRSPRPAHESHAPPRSVGDRRGSRTALYWFPRDCPRVTAWPRTVAEQLTFAALFHTTAPRVHAIESRWLDAMRSTMLYRYTLPAEPFEPWPDASGQWISETEVEPLDMSPVGDLLALHTQVEHRGPHRSEPLAAA